MKLDTEVKHNGGHGGAQGQVHDVLRGDRLPGQGKDHHGDDDQAAADPQEAGQDAGDGANA